jgi:hypothetical protein
VTDGQDYRQSGQYPQPGQQPQPGYGQQYDPQDQQWPQPGYGQQYPPDDQPWQPQNDPRQYRRRPGGPPEGPWQQAPYPPRDYPPQAPYPQQAPYPPQAPYPQQGYPPRGQWQPQAPRQDYGHSQPPGQGHHRKRSRTPLYAGVAALIVIAGGGTAYALAGHGGSPSPATGSTAQAAAKPASLSQLKKIVLQRGDVPSSWKAAPYQPDPNDAANNAALMRCVGARDTDSDKVAEANSDNFNLGNASIASSATSYRSQSDLVSDVATLHSPKLSACFGQMMKKELAASLPKGATTKSASIKITPGSAGGPSNVVATGTGTIEIQLNGQQVQAYLTVAFITGPLIEAEVDAENVGSPVPASVVKPLVAAVANRAAKG